jgi:hypothetical protein
MVVALGGTCYFCFVLLQAVGGRDEDMTLLQVFRPHLGQLSFGVFLVLGSWISGFIFGKGLLQK